ncbi:MAG TPA: hypothetical protein VJN95_17860, partial [Gemmatimonadales bacterium]|nr:hypothetical protein [Gemmatimonadales bacterium]
MSAAALLLLAACSSGSIDRSGDWPAYGHDALGSRYSPLTDVTPQNVSGLAEAWTFHTGEMDPSLTTRKPTGL